MGEVGFIAGVLLLFGIPAWAAASAWERHRVWAACGALLATAAWCGLLLWLIH